MRGPLKTLAVLLACAAVFFVFACRAKTEKPSAAAGAASHRFYQCPMHPQILTEKPGNCPLCGMKLVPLTGKASAEDSARGAAAIRIDPRMAQNLGVRTERVSRRPLASELRLDGQISAQENRLYSLSVRVMGYVEKVRVSAGGQRVARGQILVDLYSPDVIIAQERLHQARDRQGAPGESVEAARQRLLNWNLPETFVDRVERDTGIQRLFPMAAPAAGIIVQKSVVPGESVMAGRELFRIADLSEVWVTARLYQPDLAWVRVGSRAVIRLRNFPGRDFQSRVSFISPEMDPATRTAQIRMNLPNTPGWDLRPEMFAEIVLRDTSSTPVLAVPSQSLIRTGGRDVIVAALGGGRFAPRPVRAGREAGGYVEILEGLGEGENIVVSAQFLIDAESNLRAAVARLGAGTGGAEETGPATVHAGD